MLDISEEQTLTEQANTGIDWLRQELDKIIGSYQVPHEKRVGYGNLRHEYSDWKNDGEEVVNVAIIYETPGGSTTQLNVSFSCGEQAYSYLDGGLGDYVETPSGREVLEFIHEHVEEIPGKRADQLKAQVDIWMEEGKSRQEVFAKLNKLLHEEFLGGRITTGELKIAIQHAIKTKKAD